MVDGRCNYRYTVTINQHFFAGGHHPVVPLAFLVLGGSRYLDVPGKVIEKSSWICRRSFGWLDSSENLPFLHDFWISQMLHVWNIYLDLPIKWHSFVGTYSIHGAFYGIFSSHDVPCTCFFSGGWVGFGFFANFSIATRNIVEPLPYCCTSLWTRFLYMDGSVFMEKSRWKWMICGYPPWRRTPQNGRFGFLFFSFVFSARKAGFQDIFFQDFSM